MSSTSIIFSLLSVGLVAASLKGISLPVLNNPKIVMAVIIVLGMAMCTSGIGKVAAANSWTHPFSILGYLVGGLILVIAAATWLGKPLPLIPTAQAALVAVLVLEALKFVLTRVHALVR